jgi:hypothetical protein
MKIKLVVIDLEIPHRVRKWAIRVGLPAALLLGAGTVAYAGGLVSWSAGQTLTASDLNENFNYIQGEIAALQAQSHPPSAFRAHTSNGLTVPTNTRVTGLFDVVDFDLAHEYDPATGTFTATQAGVYLLSCEFFGPGEYASGFSSGVIKNGQSIELDVDDRQNTTTASTLNTHSVAIAQLAAGDTITCVAYQSTGATIALTYLAGRNIFSGSRLY